MKKQAIIFPLFMLLLTSCGGSTKSLSSITVTCSGLCKDTYAVGETFSAASLYVDASYSDGTNKQVTNFTTSIQEGYKFTLDDVDKVKSYKVTYVEDGKTATSDQKITVYRKVESLDLSGEYKKSYKVGDKFSTAGLVVTGKYKDGGSAVLTTYTTEPENGYTFKTEDINPEFVVWVEYSSGYNIVKSSFIITVAE